MQVVHRILRRFSTGACWRGWNAKTSSLDGQSCNKAANTLAMVSTTIARCHLEKQLVSFALKCKHPERTTSASSPKRTARKLFWQPKKPHQGHRIHCLACLLDSDQPLGILLFRALKIPWSSCTIGSCGPPFAGGVARHQVTSNG